MEQYSENPGFKHGLASEQYWEMWASQHGWCAVCLKRLDHDGDRPSRPCVDHDHLHCPGGKGCPTCVRSLLCQSCNLMLGRAHDDPAVLRRWKPNKRYTQERINAAIAYLEYWHAEMAKRGIRPSLDDALWGDVFNAISRLVAEIA